MFRSRHLCPRSLWLLKADGGRLTHPPHLLKCLTACSFSPPTRLFSNSQRRFSQVDAAEGTPAASLSKEKHDNLYHGPLAPTFRRLKIFSLASLGLSATLAPFMFLIESNLPMTARFALAGIALGTSGTSTALVGWCGKPYVTTLRRTKQDENGGTEVIEMSTLTLTLQPRLTRVYDPSFLIETQRGFAKWELADYIVIKGGAEVKSSTPGQEETIAETMDKKGEVIGRWVVKWGENGEGKCQQIGKVVRYFNVHEELLH